MRKCAISGKKHEEKTEYLVREIIDKRITDSGNIQYRVECDSTREPAENLICTDLINDFEKKREDIEMKVVAPPSIPKTVCQSKAKITQKKRSNMIVSCAIKNGNAIVNCVDTSKKTICSQRTCASVRNFSHDKILPNNTYPDALVRSYFHHP